MDSIGERLRQERVRRGWEIEGIAERTKISPSLLQAIENNDLSKLPGTFFTRSFVRQYARALGLDEAEFDSELNQVAAPPPPEAPPAVKPDFGDRIRMQGLEPSRRIGGGFAGPLVAFVLVVAICSVVYTFWQRMRPAAPPPERPKAAAQAKPKPVSPTPAAAPQQPAAQQPGAQQPSATPTPAEPAAQVSAAPTAAPVPAQTAAPATPQLAPPATAVAPAASAPVRLELRAAEAAWVRVTADGKVVFTGTLEAGQSRVFGGNEMIRIRTGNAGGVEATWNGKPAGPLGPAGQVRDVEFTPSAFRIVPPAPKPPAEPKPPEEIKQ